MFFTRTGVDGWQIFHATGGLEQYVKWLNRDNTPLHEPIVFSKAVDGVRVEVSLQWCSDTFSDTMLGFVNSIRTVDGGTHMDGTKAALTRTVNALARKVRVHTQKQGFCISSSCIHIRCRR